MSETIEIEGDVARRLFEAMAEREGSDTLPEVSDTFDCPRCPHFFPFFRLGKAMVYKDPALEGKQ